MEVIIMNEAQKYTPKYWVGHNKETDDVFITTASKNKGDVYLHMEATFGEDFYLDDNFEVILIEIKQVIV
jgi:hypothetical protein